MTFFLLLLLAALAQARPFEWHFLRFTGLQLACSSLAREYGETACTMASDRFEAVVVYRFGGQTHVPCLDAAGWWLDGNRRVTFQYGPYYYYSCTHDAYPGAYPTGTTTASIRHNGLGQGKNQTAGASLFLTPSNGTALVGWIPGRADEDFYTGW